MLAAVAKETTPDAVGRAIYALAVNTSMGSSAADEAAAKPLPPAAAALLSNALAAAAACILDSAAKAGVPVMELRCAAGQASAADDGGDGVVMSEDGVGRVVKGDSSASLPLLLDALLWLAEHGAVLGGMPAALLEQALEGTPVSGCEAVFGALETRLDAFRSERLRARAALTLQRSCNALMARLSRTQHARLAGRVHICLAKLLPLMERSGVNLQGTFHTDNVTPVEDVAEDAKDSLGEEVDGKFYRSFWGLQAVFADPPRAAERWGETSRAIQTVLGRMGREPITLTEASTGGALGISAKYLSSSRLLALQLRDATFRRHFLVQALILLQFLQNPRPAKQSWAALKGRQLEDAQVLETALYKALSESPESGAEFAAAIHELLENEDSWTTWKQVGCPKEPFERPAASAPETAGSLDPLGSGFARREPSQEAYYGVTLGCDELDRLWNLSEDNASALPVEDREGFKSLDQLLEPVIDEMTDPDQEPLLATDTTYSWRTLRLVSRVNLKAFVASVQAGGDLRVAARMLHPDRCPPEPEMEAAATPAVEGLAPASDQPESAAPETSPISAAAGDDDNSSGKVRDRRHERDSEEGKDETPPPSKRRRADGDGESPREQGNAADEADQVLQAGDNEPRPDSPPPGDSRAKRPPIRAVPSDSLLLQPVATGVSEEEGENGKSSAASEGALRSADVSTAGAGSEPEEGEAMVAAGDGDDDAVMTKDDDEDAEGVEHDLNSSALEAVGDGAKDQ